MSLLFNPSWGLGGRKSASLLPQVADGHQGPSYGTWPGRGGRPVTGWASLPRELVGDIASFLPESRDLMALSAVSKDCQDALARCHFVTDIRSRTQGLGPLCNDLARPPGAALLLPYHYDLVPKITLAQNNRYTPAFGESRVPHSNQLRGGEAATLFTLSMMGMAFPLWPALLSGYQAVTLPWAQNLCWQLSFWASTAAMFVGGVDLDNRAENVKLYWLFKLSKRSGSPGNFAFFGGLLVGSAAMAVSVGYGQGNADARVRLRCRFAPQVAYACVCVLVAAAHLGFLWARRQDRKAGRSGTASNRPPQSPVAHVVARDNLRRRLSAVARETAAIRHDDDAARFIEATVRAAGDVDWRDAEGRDPLDVAIGAKNQAMVRVWASAEAQPVKQHHLKASMAPSLPAWFFDTLYAAASARAVSSRGGALAGLHTPDERAWSLALFACEAGREDIFLHVYGDTAKDFRQARIDESVCENASLLHLWSAASGANVPAEAAMRALLDDGADVHGRRQALAPSPLHVAIANDDAQAARLLLDHHACLDLADARGVTARDLFRYVQASRCRALLAER